MCVGEASDIIWLQSDRYKHQQVAEWIGYYDNKTYSYSSLNKNHIDHALLVVQAIIDQYKGNKAVIGLEPINEPWYFTPIDVLKLFYWNVYSMVQQQTPKWITLFHDAFHLNSFDWAGFLLNCPNFALDTHIYLAWADPKPQWIYQSTACNNGLSVRRMERMGLPVVVGEWSLATGA